MWQETTRHERNLKIWREELDDFVPNRILDFHVHVFHAETLPQGEPFDCAGNPLDRYDFDDLKRDLAEAYPGREVSAVCFGMPFPHYHWSANNRYVAAGCDRRRFFALRVVDPTEDPEVLRNDIQARGFVGLKPYPDLVGKKDVTLVEIQEMLPAPIMRVADEMGLLIMLHIPRKLRLADPLNQRQLVELCAAWPRVKIILAHVGRAYYLKNIVGQLDRLKDLPNLYYDLTMLNHWEVIEYLMQNVSEDKILHGTDIPISLAAGKSIEINDQYTYVTPRPWSLSISDDHRKLLFTSFLYEQLRATRKAVQRLGLGREFVEKLFYENGMGLLQGFLKER